MQELFTVNIVKTKTGEVIRQHTKCARRRAEKIKAGIEINLNHNEYEVNIEIE